MSNIQRDMSELIEAASALNTASDELSGVVSLLDAGLKKLNLGVGSWFTYGKDGDGYRYAIGYDKVDDKWGLSIREEDTVQGTSAEWLFSNAPRVLRIEAVEHLSSLLVVMKDDVAQLISVLRAKTDVVAELTKGITK